MEQIGQRQQVGTAAGRKILRDEAVIQRRQRVPVRVGRLGQKGFQFPGEGQLTRPARTGDDVGVGAAGQNRQQRPAACPVKS